MNTIPKHLQPWAAELSLMHADCWPFLGQLLPRLNNAVSRQTIGIEDVRSHPDGFDGADSQGHLSRLLATEWGLIDSFPEEFYRRVLMGESQSLKQAYEKQRRPQSFYVLLDRGPDQYGAPILVQLAYLLVLARRASQQNQSLSVGFIQEPGQWLIATPSILEQHIHPFFSHARVVPEMLQAWKEEIVAADSRADLKTIWAVSSPRQPVPVGQQLIVAADVQEKQNKRILEILFKPSQQKLRVELPAEEVAIRLLRRPFKQRITRAHSRIITQPSSSKLFRNLSLAHFRLHPIGRAGFFRDGEKLSMLVIPKKVVTNVERLRYEERQLDRLLIGVWKRRNKMLTVEADDSTLYCTGFFQQPQPITIRLDQLNAQLNAPFVVSQAVSQTVQAPPIAYVMSARKTAAIIVKDGDRNGVMLKFYKRSNESKFAFKQAIALGKIEHENFSDYAFYYTDGGSTFYEMKLIYDQPKVIRCDRPVRGFLTRYGYANGSYRAAMPLMKETNGKWSEMLTEVYPCLSDEVPVGIYRNQLIVQAQSSGRQLWIYPDIRQSNHEEVEGDLLLEEKQTIENVVYQHANSWIVYQTASCFKVFDLDLKTEIMNLEVPSYAL